MRKIGNEISHAITQLGEGSEEARINLRIQQVRERYKKAIEVVYRHDAPLHLAHTNNVIITTKDGVKTLIVYVDESLFAAELNAQRELIKLKLLELFDEDIDDFQIMTSKRRKYREMHPYATGSEKREGKNTREVTLDNEERSFVSNTVAHVDDKKVRESLKKAMTADLEWKKAKK